MDTPSPLRRCLVLVCYGAAAILAAGAWKDYQSPYAQGGVQALVPLRLGRLMPPLYQAPETLVTASLRIEISLAERRLRLYQNDAVMMTAPVAVGQADWQTPLGQFAVRSMREDPVWQHPITKAAVGPGPENPLGSHWIGFAVEGDYHIGIHGTNQDTLIGEAVSHGCVRMLNRDIQALYSHIRVGTPIVVKP